MKKNVLILFLFFFYSFMGYSQDLFNSRDLSTFKTEALTQADIAKIDSQLKSQGSSIDQFRAVALSRGMTDNEFNKLKGKLSSVSTLTKKANADANEEKVDVVKQKLGDNKVNNPINPLVFGSELFNNPNLNFEPNLQLATPVNYVLGPDDELQISIYGVQDFSTTVKVSNEAKIDIQNVGQINVAGMTIEAATSKINSAISSIFMQSSGQGAPT